MMIQLFKMNRSTSVLGSISETLGVPSFKRLIARSLPPPSSTTESLGILRCCCWSGSDIRVVFFDTGHRR